MYTNLKSSSTGLLLAEMYSKPRGSFNQLDMNMFKDSVSFTCKKNNLLLLCFPKTKLLSFSRKKGSCLECSMEIPGTFEYQYHY
jgi:hypothetical protein